MTILPITTLSFPEIHLAMRDAHKLRGYFGKLFRDHSPLLHNHFEDGRSRYTYPLVQYKILHNVPILVGLGEGADLLAELFLKTKELNIEGQIYPIFAKEIKHQRIPIGFTNVLENYYFSTLWLALNQVNYQIYQQLAEEKKINFLEKILTGNILSFFKTFKHFFDSSEIINVEFDPDKERTTKFKNQNMLAFSGRFSANICLPDNIGLGKAVARGFGTIQKIC